MSLLLRHVSRNCDSCKPNSLLFSVYIISSYCARVQATYVLLRESIMLLRAIFLNSLSNKVLLLSRFTGTIGGIATPFGSLSLNPAVSIHSIDDWSKFQSNIGISTQGNCRPLDLWIVITRMASMLSGEEIDKPGPTLSHHFRK